MTLINSIELKLQGLIEQRKQLTEELESAVFDMQEIQLKSGGKYLKMILIQKKHIFFELLLFSKSALSEWNFWQKCAKPLGL